MNKAGYQEQFQEMPMFKQQAEVISNVNSQSNYASNSQSNYAKERACRGHDKCGSCGFCMADRSENPGGSVVAMRRDARINISSGEDAFAFIDDVADLAYIESRELAYG